MLLCHVRTVCLGICRMDSCRASSIFSIFSTILPISHSSQPPAFTALVTIFQPVTPRPPPTDSDPGDYIMALRLYRQQCMFYQDEPNSLLTDDLAWPQLSRREPLATAYRSPLPPSLLSPNTFLAAMYPEKKVSIHSGGCLNAWLRKLTSKACQSLRSRLRNNLRSRQGTATASPHIPGLLPRSQTASLYVLKQSLLSSVISSGQSRMK